MDESQEESVVLLKKNDISSKKSNSEESGNGEDLDNLDYGALDSTNILKRLRLDDSPFYSDKEPVIYDGTSHLEVICQLHGSVWKYVLPYCIVNVMLTYLISYLSVEYQTDITLPASGHKFMITLVSFLVVSRVQITYNRFIEARKHLGNCFRSCRELVHNACILTIDSDSDEAVEWRKRMGEKVLTMLRITIAAIEFSSRGENPWKYLPQREKVSLPTEELKGLDEIRNLIRNINHYERSEQDDALRAPLIYSSIIRAEIMSPRQSKCLAKDMSDLEELKLLGHVAEFTTAYHGLNKLITTPFPFPLVQKTRTILFVWLFTLPLSLMKDAGSPWEEMVMIFFVTYGFLGLEYVSIELDDPYGNDDNDFDSLGMAQRVYEDIYMTIFECDGQEAAESLRKSNVQPDAQPQIETGDELT